MSTKIPDPPRPTDGELEILTVLWNRGRSTVREVHEAVSRRKPTQYTTVLKLLQIMTGKGLVDRDENCRPQIYRARQSREQTQRQLLRDLLDRAFGVSVRTMVLQALATKKSSAEELEAIEKFLDRLEGGTK